MVLYFYCYISFSINICYGKSDGLLQTRCEVKEDHLRHRRMDISDKITEQESAF